MINKSTFNGIMCISEDSERYLKVAELGRDKLVRAFAITEHSDLSNLVHCFIAGFSKYFLKDHSKTVHVGCKRKLFANGM